MRKHPRADRLTVADWAYLMGMVLLLLAVGMAGWCWIGWPVFRWLAWRALEEWH